MIHSMRSGTSIHSGERRGCIGCHESRTGLNISNTQGELTLALKRRPNKLTPWYGEPRRFNYLTERRDVEDWRRAIRLTREIIDQGAFEPYRGEEIQPGAGLVDDEAVDAWIRANVESAYHPSCTCKMGAAGDPMAVLDPECRVRGIESLRVVDSSVFPTIPNGNLNAPTIMVGEKAADLIRGRAPLPPSNAGVWVNPRWEQAQR